MYIFIYYCKLVYTRWQRYYNDTKHRITYITNNNTQHSKQYTTNKIKKKTNKTHILQKERVAKPNKKNLT